MDRTVNDEHLLARNAFIGDLYNEFQQEQSRENFLRVHNLRAEEPGLFTAENEEMMREMIREGVRQEIAWGKYAIGNEVEGLNEKMIEDYVRYLGNVCAENIGLGALYKGYEEELFSMHWVSQYANPNFIKTDFIEGRSTAYAKSTALVDDL